MAFIGSTALLSFRTRGTGCTSLSGNASGTTICQARRRQMTIMCAQPPNASTDSSPSTGVSTGVSSSASSSGSDGGSDEMDPGRAAVLALEARVRTSLAADGIDYDLLLNGPRVMKLYRKLEELKSGDVVDSSEVERVTQEYERERRNVMRTGLKRVFEIQAVVSALIGGALAFNATGDIELVYRALGFWTVWLFTVPSLRARKGLRAFEKSALNVSFLALPFVNVGLAGITRKTGVIWTADIFLLVVFYLYYGVRSVDGEEKKEEGRVTGVLRYLDWGSWR